MAAVVPNPMYASFSEKALRALASSPTEFSVQAKGYEDKGGIVLFKYDVSVLGTFAPSVRNARLREILRMSLQGAVVGEPTPMGTNLLMLVNSPEISGTKAYVSIAFVTSPLSDIAPMARA